MLLREGEIIRNVYEVERFLGEGAFAEVYRVKHRFLGRQAMKIFKSSSPRLPEIERNLTEAMLLSKIGHPNIIRVFDAGVLETDSGQRGYFTMENAPGGTLETFWNSYRDSFVPISDTVNIIRQVCTGLTVAHSDQPPLIHRDIKPQNILVGYDCNGLRIKISDFGIAKTVNPLTLLASARGTPAFMAPESLYDMDSCASDIWSVGVTLYLLLTDRLPFPIESRLEFSTGKCWEKELIPAIDFNPRVDAFLDSIISRALSINPVDRYPNAMEMLKDLMQWKPPKVIFQADSAGSIDDSKIALGSIAQPQRQKPETMVKKALMLAKDAGKLMEAADILEEVLTSNPKLRGNYEYQLALWRRGVAM